MAKSRDTANFLFGCIGGKRRVSELVDAGSGAIRVRSGQTLEQALAAQPSGRLDILGGGYPLQFATRGAQAP